MHLMSGQFLDKFDVVAHRSINALVTDSKSVLDSFLYCAWLAFPGA